MLPKRRRIPRSDFPADFRGAIVLHGEYLTLRTVPSPRATAARVSVVVSKKASRRAVDRHLVKRRVYDIAARTKNLSPASYVFFAKAGAHEISFTALHDEAAELLARVSYAIVNKHRLV